MSTRVYENQLAEEVVHQATPGYSKCAHMVRHRRSGRSQPEKWLHIVLKHGGTLQKPWIEAAMMELLSLSTAFPWIWACHPHSTLLLGPQSRETLVLAHVGQKWPW